MPQQTDFVAIYGKSLGFSIASRTVLVEGTTDVDLFNLAARLEREHSGEKLLGKDLTIVSSGVADRGGTRGVIRQLVTLREMAQTCLLNNGRPRYRFIGLLDNDKAGRAALKTARAVDTSMVEYRDLFRLCPVMPWKGNLDPKSLQKNFERENSGYKGLDWELEDLLPQNFYDAFLGDFPSAVTRSVPLQGKIHRDLTRDGKAKLHRFIKTYAEYKDLQDVINVLKAIRFYLGLR